MVLIKYSGKYVKIYFNMKITFFDYCKPPNRRFCPLKIEIPPILMKF